ncbi:MAG: chemotaxis protein CheX [Verrucomicrobiota bacterium]|nr:chemotaxis protein CheX [Verrucomicrobiota bacterium]
MNNTPSILDTTVVGQILDQAVKDVFDTMLSMNSLLIWSSPEIVKKSDSIDPAESLISDMAIHNMIVVGTVGFVGEVNGLIYLYVDLPFATKITQKLLQIDLDALGEDADGAVNDAIGEITNMVVGVFKNKLCDQGYPCRLTIPSILRGTDISVEPVGYAHRRIYKFDIAGSLLTTDVVMKFGD